MSSADKSPSPVRVLVVDDSAFMRKAIAIMLESDPSIEVVGMANNGEEGVEKVEQLNPDLVTMDIEMPRMDGLTALREIMQRHPVPVMMVSSVTTEGAEATLQALELGAVDFIPKQSSYVSLDIVKIKEELLQKIKSIARRKHILMAMHRQRLRGSSAPAVTLRRPVAPAPRVSVATPVILGKRSHPVGIIAIGSSTGGPPALQSVLTQLPRNLPVGVVVAQHMPPTFTKSLAERLDTLTALTVREARDREILEPGTVLIAPGGMHLTVKKLGSRATVSVSEHPRDTLYHPCVDLLMSSVAESFQQASLSVILTGMGANGLDGVRRIKQAGGVVIAQDEATSVVYGMPRAVIEADLADHVAPIENIAGEILSFF